jgi:hypothetical protein
MTVGTKSVLFGAHCFLIHGFFVARGWSMLWGFPWDPRLWAAFFVHDLGYLGSPNMDGREGEEHVHLGAKIMGLLFGDPWADFTLDTRYWAKKAVRVSKFLLRRQASVRDNARLVILTRRATGDS